MHTPRFARDAAVAILSLLFSVLFIWYSRNTGQQPWYVEWGPFLMAGAAFMLGIPVFLSMRSRMGAPPPVPPYR
jgi:APA family basic amino acid/polyamine antiporter